MVLSAGCCGDGWWLMMWRVLESCCRQVFATTTVSSYRAILTPRHWTGSGHNTHTPMSPQTWANIQEKNRPMKCSLEVFIEFTNSWQTPTKNGKEIKPKTDWSHKATALYRRGRTAYLHKVASVNFMVTFISQLVSEIQAIHFAFMETKRYDTLNPCRNYFNTNIKTPLCAAKFHSKSWPASNTWMTWQMFTRMRTRESKQAL